MHITSSLLAALAAGIPSTRAISLGFNYGSTFNNGAPKHQSDFEAEFRTARSLVGAPAGGFTSARLYTTIQSGTANEPISAIPAALATKTTLLLGIWCSAGDGIFNAELQALRRAIDQYGDQLKNIIVGISVGSEDLYRISPTGILNKENPGAQPNTIAGYIKRVRDTIAGTPMRGVPIGHVDTWTAWVNGSNQAVIDASDWIGFDAYPYFQETNVNSIANSKALFDKALADTKAAVGGKPVWVTETGFPVSGKTVGLAVPSLSNAEIFWNQVGCPMFGKTNVWWYTFQDSVPFTPNPSFGIIGNTLTTRPLFDISCKDAGAPSPSLSRSTTATSSTTAMVGTTERPSPTQDGSVTETNSGTNDSLATSATPADRETTGTGPGETSETGSPSGTGSSNASPSPSSTPNAAGVVSGSLGSAAVGALVGMFLL